MTNSTIACADYAEFSNDGTENPTIRFAAHGALVVEIAGMVEPMPELVRQSAAGLALETSAQMNQVSLAMAS